MIAMALGGEPTPPRRLSGLEVKKLVARPSRAQSAADACSSRMAAIARAREATAASLARGVLKWSGTP